MVIDAKVIAEPTLRPTPTVKSSPISRWSRIVAAAEYDWVDIRYPMTILALKVSDARAWNSFG
jgi:hypothetical protein